MLQEYIPKKTVIVSTASLNLIANDPANNFELIKSAIKSAVLDKAGILLLPELTLTSYDAGQAFNSSENSNANILLFLKKISDYAKDLDPNLLVSIGHSLQVTRHESEPHTHDSALICQSYLIDGKIIGIQSKIDLANNNNNAATGPEYEWRYFKNWRAHQASRITLKDLGITSSLDVNLLEEFFPNEGIKLGDIEVALLVDKNEYILIKTSICESAWTGFQIEKDGLKSNFIIDKNNIQHSSLLGRRNDNPLSLVLIPNGSPPAAGKGETRISLLNAIFKETNSAVVYVNALGSPAFNLCFKGDKIYKDANKLVSAQRLSFRLLSHCSETLEINTLASEDIVKNESTIIVNSLIRTPTPQDILNINNKNELLAIEENKVTYHSSFDIPAVKIEDRDLIFDNLRATDKKFKHDPLIENAALHAEEMFLHDALYFLDYMTRKKMHSCFVALSGGYDSAYTLTVGCTAIELCMREHLANSNYFLGTAINNFFKERFEYHIILKLALVDIVDKFFPNKLKITMVSGNLNTILNDTYELLNSIQSKDIKAKILNEILKEFKSKLFNTAYIATNANSRHTENAARKLAESFNVPFRKVNIQSGVEDSILTYLLPEPVTVSDLDSMATFYSYNSQDINRISCVQKLRGKQGLISFVLNADKNVLPVAIKRLADHLNTIFQYLAEYWEVNLKLDQNNQILAEKLLALKNIIIEINVENFPSWGGSDKTRLNLENLQARLRAAMNWFINSMIPNTSMPTCNANLSEAVRAYTTYGGDEHAGTFSVTLHRNKCDILMIMTLLSKKEFKISITDIENSKLCCIPPVEALDYIFAIPPSAELQPLQDGKIKQTDEDSFGMSYFQLRILMEELFFNVDPMASNLHLSPKQVLAKLINASWAIELWVDALIRQKELVKLIDNFYSSFYYAQFKIRALPIGPIYGSNINQHFSLRTPNMSGQQRGERMIMILTCILYQCSHQQDSSYISQIYKDTPQSEAAMKWLEQVIFFNCNLQNFIEKIFIENGKDVFKASLKFREKFIFANNNNLPKSINECIILICEVITELSSDYSIKIDFNFDELSKYLNSARNNNSETLNTLQSSKNFLPLHNLYLSEEIKEESTDKKQINYKLK